MTEETPKIDAEVLADLAHKLVDQVALYGTAAGQIAAPALKKAVQDAKDDRARLLQNVTAKMWLSDMSLIDQATRLGTARNAFERLHASKDDAAVLLEVLQSEDYLCRRIVSSIEELSLSSHMKNYLQTLLIRVETTLQSLKSFKN